MPHIDLQQQLIDELGNILDTLWLAKKCETAQEEESQTVRGGVDDTREDKISKNNDTSSEEPTKEPDSTPQNQTPLYTKTKTKNRDSRVNIEEIRIPKKQAIQHYRKLEKAYKPLKTTITNRRKKIIDEEASVEHIAQTDIYMMKYRYEQAPTYELTLLIDKNKTMDFFQDLISTYVDSVQHYGVFKKVNIFYLGAEERPRIYRDKNLKKHIKPSSILSRNKNLILILTDSISPAWRSNQMFHLIDKLSKVNLCSIVQMLPRNMWLLTSLQRGVELIFNTSKVSPVNSDISSQKEFLFFDSSDELLRIPVITFEHLSFEAWANIAVGNPKYYVTGIALDKDALSQQYTITKSEITPQERLDNFLSNATMSAKRLASYLANLPITYEVARVVQELKLKKTTTAQLCEVFLGDIIQRVEIDGVVSYDFYDGIRDRLKHNIAPYEALELFNQITDFIDRGIDSALNFRVLIVNPNASKEVDWSSDNLKLANIAIDILKRNGGEYYDRAVEIEQSIELLTSSPTPQTKHFLMGSDERDEEKPIHKVTINYDFEIAKYPVTVGEFKAFVEDERYTTEAERGDGAYIWDGKEYDKKDDASWENPYFDQTDKHPVVCISWNDTQAYIQWLNKQTGEDYRLPTEAEWEYSCRAETTSKWSFGDEEKELEKYAWYDENSKNKTHPVGEKEPNPWGVYDMHGNVYEWCEDWYSDNYSDTPRDGTANGKGKKEEKVLRGGSWYIFDYFSRSAYRGRGNPAISYNFVGFRLLRTLPF